MATATSQAAIRTKALRKSYGDTAVLDGIDLHVQTGTVFGLLGPNGAGKTTMVKILSTLISADSGEAYVLGNDRHRNPDAVRAGIGVTGQFSAVDDLLTGRENLLLMADLRHLGRHVGRQRAIELLERFDLVEAADKPASTYSGGMRRRLDLAMTLVGNPRLIFLDEPTTGLDPRSRHELWRIIWELVEEGVTIFLTTQYMEEADQLADRIAVLDRGTIVAEGTVDELKARIPGGHIRLHFADPEQLAVAAATVTHTRREDESLSLQVPTDTDFAAMRALLDRLSAADVEFDSLSVHRPDLDDVFLTLTGQANAGAGTQRQEAQ
ncbi:ATP-binding cassette domain-containing protein [Haloechinothrix sp. LS1_15]|uniref:ATP-binding cassette domain-containing protein n=1 Tax=Haloechinothrix sp. LS1_15 TaxID=2652248 RepID=UPI002947E45F|nr:ATP-binding cassette domain-containing protein [Haloechinothrix sp. LS1_15]MDV6011016.1 ATP-binding cassette domain-containing protein [Haloechinothrix sp. LS1_15]